MSLLALASQGFEVQTQNKGNTSRGRKRLLSGYCPSGRREFCSSKSSEKNGVSPIFTALLSLWEGLGTRAWGESESESLRVSRLEIFWRERQKTDRLVLELDLSVSAWFLRGQCTHSIENENNERGKGINDIVVGILGWCLRPWYFSGSFFSFLLEVTHRDGKRLLLQFCWQLF